MMAALSPQKGVQPFDADIAAHLEATQPTWVRNLRELAAKRWAALGMPAAKAEAWRYTPVSKRLQPLLPKLEPARSQPVDIAALGAWSPEAWPGPQLTFVDGSFSPALSRLETPEGVLVQRLSDIADDAEIQETLGSVLDDETHALAALNTALFSDAVVLRWKSGTTVQTPVHVLFVSSGRANVQQQQRVLALVEETAGGVLWETHLHLGGEAASFDNTVVECTLAPDARLHHGRLQRPSSAAVSVSKVGVRQARDSHYTSSVVSLGGGLVRNDLDILLEAEGAGCTLNGVSMTAGRDHIDQHTRIDHRAPHTQSRELYKGVLAGQSTGVFNGRVYVHADAQKTDSAQSNKNLLLSDNATINSKPELEIYADDVRCAHGATVGQLDPEALFYLRSRGIPPDQARRKLTEAFALEVVKALPEGAPRDTCAQAMKQWLEEAL